MNIPSESNFHMNSKNYELIKEIGNGTFGRVWMAKDKGNNEFVAIKRRPKWQNSLSREVEAMEAVKGNNGIVQIEGCFYSITPGGVIMQNIVMPLMSKSLGSFLRENRLLRKRNSLYRLPPDLIKNIAFQIVDGLFQLHSSGYTHRDFKPDNILMMDDNSGKFPKICICDLGSSKKLVPNGVHMPYVVSRFYRAPELLLGSCKYNEKIDIWALGCIFVELLTLDPIFVGRCPEKQKNTGYSMKQGIDEPFQLLKIIEILGSPSSDEINALKGMISNSVNGVYNELYFLDSKIHPISWYELLEGIFIDEERPFIELIKSCIQWDPNKRPSLRVKYRNNCLKGKLYSSIGEAMTTLMELSEVDNAAEIFDYSKMVESEMKKNEKVSKNNTEIKLARNILMDEISGVEDDIESLRIEYSRVTDKLSNSIKEKRTLEAELNNMKYKYRSVVEELNKIRNILSIKSEELEKHTITNNCMKEEIKELELGIAIEENVIEEKKKQLKALEINNIITETEGKKLSKQILQGKSELERKTKIREIVEERMSLNSGKAGNEENENYENNGHNKYVAPTFINKKLLSKGTRNSSISFLNIDIKRVNTNRKKNSK
ncbi:putative protein kinase [Cryptosporidium felis]|nr:putative protein kinase [Cryptosporidium felis]